MSGRRTIGPRPSARFPNRLIAFCSVNPLNDYAVDEIARCAQGGRFKGLKLHFGNSRVDVLNNEHVDKLRRVFSAANERHLPIVVHLWTGRNYGQEHAEVFLKRILPTAPDVVVQIAHFAGGGPGYTESALAVYAEAIAAGQPVSEESLFRYRHRGEQSAARVNRRYRRSGFLCTGFSAGRKASTFVN